MFLLFKIYLLLENSSNVSSLIDKSLSRDGFHQEKAFIYFDVTVNVSGPDVATTAYLSVSC